jgi:hypothetical protein
MNNYESDGILVCNMDIGCSFRKLLAYSSLAYSKSEEGCKGVPKKTYHLQLLVL